MKPLSGLSSAKTKWYGAIGLFRHSRQDKRFVPRYEERVVLLAGRNRTAAEKKALREFSAYSDKGVAFLNQYEIFELDGAPSARCVLEVAWLVRTTPMKPKEYIQALWGDLRPKSCEDLGWDHYWYNIDNKRSGCYNCLKIRKGKLWGKEEGGQ